MPANKRMTAAAADYMELDGAQKDADCQKVEVKGGVSSQLGCCNEFDPNKAASQFRCGQCEYLVAPAQGNQFYGESLVSNPSGNGTR